MTKSSKVQDGTIRLEFTAGAAASRQDESAKALVEQTAKLLGCTSAQIPGRAEELFEKWKKAKKNKLAIQDFGLTSTASFEGDVIVEAARILKTQPEHVIKTIQKFQKQMEQFTRNNRFKV